MNNEIKSNILSGYSNLIKVQLSCRGIKKTDDFIGFENDDDLYSRYHNRFRI